MGHSSGGFTHTGLSCNPAWLLQSFKLKKLSCQRVVLHFISRFIWIERNTSTRKKGRNALG